MPTVLVPRGSCARAARWSLEHAGAPARGPAHLHALLPASAERHSAVLTVMALPGFQRMSCARLAAQQQAAQAHHSLSTAPHAHAQECSVIHKKRSDQHCLHSRPGRQAVKGGRQCAGPRAPGARQLVAVGDAVGREVEVARAGRRAAVLLQRRGGVLRPRAQVRVGPVAVRRVAQQVQRDILRVLRELRAPCAAPAASAPGQGSAAGHATVA